MGKMVKIAIRIPAEDRQTLKDQYDTVSDGVRLAVRQLLRPVQQARAPARDPDPIRPARVRHQAPDVHAREDGYNWAPMALGLGGIGAVGAVLWYALK